MSSNLDLEILYEDPHVVCVHKPAGVPVHRSHFVGKMDAVPLLQQVRDQVGCYVFAVHRIDQPASGLVLFAKSPEMASKLGNLLQTRQFKKTYQAIVRGWFKEPELWCDIPLKSHKDDALKPSQSYFRVLKNWEWAFAYRGFDTVRYSLIEASPVTGRWHQLRRHLAHLSHPIIGDTVHGDGFHNALWEKRSHEKRLYLASTGIEFIHPASNERLEIKKPSYFSDQEFVEGLSSIV